MELNSIKENPTQWFEIPETGVSIKLQLPGRAELSRDFRSCQRKTRNGEVLDDKKFAQLMARKYILDVKGITEDGKEVGYNQEVGLILLDDQRFGKHIESILFDGAEWSDLGNE